MASPLVDKEQDVSAIEGFTVGSGTYSVHVYLPKMYALFGGLDPAEMYETMTSEFMKAADQHLFFRPMLPDEEDVLMSGNVDVDDNGNKTFDHESEHMACFIGGTFALGGRLFEVPDHVETGKKPAKGCAYAYQAFPSGMMPERFNAITCTHREQQSAGERRVYG